MPDLDLITTTAGRQAILDAIAGGTSITVQDIRFSDTDQAVDISTTALSSIVATVAAAGEVRPAGAGHALHIVVTDSSTAEYDVRALALRLSTGDLLMVYSQAGLIATKAAGSSMHFALDLTIDADTAATIDFGDTDYLLPAASETAAGIVELATDAEVQAGADAVRAVTPAGLASLTATETRRGLIELATTAAALVGLDTVRAITPATLKAYVNDVSHAFTQPLSLNDSEISRTAYKERSRPLPLTPAGWTLDGNGHLTTTSDNTWRGQFTIPEGGELQYVYAVVIPGALGTLTMTVKRVPYDGAATVTLKTIPSSGTGKQTLGFGDLIGIAALADPRDARFMVEISRDSGGGSTCWVYDVIYVYHESKLVTA